MPHRPPGEVWLEKRDLQRIPTSHVTKSFAVITISVITAVITEKHLV